MADEVKFIDGLFINDLANAPDFIKDKISINVDRFIQFIQANKNEKGYVNIDILESKGTGKRYAKLNDWKPNGEQARPSQQSAASYTNVPNIEDDSELPF